MARHWGEEIAAILPNAGQEGAVQMVEVSCWAIKDLENYHTNSVVEDYLTLRLRVSSKVSNPENSPEGWSVAADKILYYAKTKGRDRTMLNLSLS